MDEDAFWDIWKSHLKNSAAASGLLLLLLIVVIAHENIIYSNDQFANNQCLQLQHY